MASLRNLIFVFIVVFYEIMRDIYVQCDVCRFDYFSLFSRVPGIVHVCVCAHFVGTMAFSWSLMGIASETLWIFIGQFWKIMIDIKKK